MQWRMCWGFEPGLQRKYAAMPSIDPMIDKENPEWTREDFADSADGSAIPDHIRLAFPKTRGRPRGSAKQLVSLRLDREVIERFRATGPGWQSRMNKVLRQASV